MPQRPDPELRRLATQIASMLPENTSEARQVLRLAAELVDNFLAAEEEPPTKPRLIDT
jgi:hypothetical protein